MMNFDIITFYTQKLNITNHLDIIDNKSSIKMNMSVNGVLENSDKWDDCLLFKVYFNCESKAPVSLNWIGVFVLKFNPEINIDDITINQIIDNKDLLNILDEFIKQFSLNLHGELPSFEELWRKC